MTFDELIEVVQGLPGRMVLASVQAPDDGNTDLYVASFSGIIGNVRRGERVDVPEHWNIWWEGDGRPKPIPGMVVLRRDGYEGATVTGTDLDFEHAVEQGQTMGEWTIEVHQSGMVIKLLVYVWSGTD